MSSPSEVPAREPPNDVERVAARLNRLLRRELAAARLCEQAERHAEDDALRSALADCRREHLARAQSLGELVRARGAEPAAPGAVTEVALKWLLGAAAAVGTITLLQVLHRGELTTLEAYRNELPQLDAEAAEAVRERLLPEQRTTETRVWHALRSIDRRRAAT